MGIMDYLPQFGQNVDQQMPQDDTLMQLDLKRKLALADSLRQQEMPQGQMVSGRYVAPAWTQYLAGALNKVQASNIEKKAYEQYSKSQSSKAQKYAELLGENDPEKFKAGLAQMPEYAPELVKARLSGMTKQDNPMIVPAGSTVYQGGQAVYTAPKDMAEKSMFGTVSPSDFTPQSLAKFAQTKNYMDLVAVPKQATPANPYYQAIPTGAGYARFNARTGQMESMPLNGQTVLPAAQTPELQGNIAGAKFGSEAKAKREFNMAGAPDIVNEARSILTGKVKPTGSGLGTILDTAGATVGLAPSGAAEADKLRAIGGQLVAKMPRMEGPQSDRDVQLYTQMAGQIGDSTIPVSRRLEALKTVEGIITKYAPKQQSVGQAKTVVRTGTDKTTGRKVVQYSDGTTAYAD